MTFDEVIALCVAEGAIRYYRVSNHLAYAYRFHEGRYQARGLYANDENWRLGKRLVSAVDYSQQSGWHIVAGLPKQARTIESESAKNNPGYGFVIFKQCYTCKEEKSILEFSQHKGEVNRKRHWECNECYERRIREMKTFNNKKSLRVGDIVEKETIASFPTPASQI